jgi:hypothetical protein
MVQSSGSKAFRSVLAKEAAISRDTIRDHDMDRNTPTSVANGGWTSDLSRGRKNHENGNRISSVGCCS